MCDLAVVLLQSAISPIGFVSTAPSSTIGTCLSFGCALVHASSAYTDCDSRMIPDVFLAKNFSNYHSLKPQTKRCDTHDNQTGEVSALLLPISATLD